MTYIKTKLYTTQRWRQLSKAVRNLEPFCRVCREVRKKLVPAEATDHIIPHQGKSKLFWDRENLRPLCNTCHGEKSGHERSTARIKLGMLPYSFRGRKIC